MARDEERSLSERRKWRTMRAESRQINRVVGREMMKEGKAV